MDPDRQKILVVDDEPYITDLLRTALTFEGFEVETASTGDEALIAVDRIKPDLMLLDVMLPDFDGTEVCRRLRAAGNSVPVVFLTAKDATEDKVSALRTGDDYVTKPFSLDELMARMRAVLRRSGHNLTGGKSLQFSDLVMNIETHEVWRNNEMIDLTATEFNLLQYLLESMPRVVSKSEILNSVWDYDFNGDANIVETYISYLRKKIDEKGPPLIQTVRRVGYTIRLPR